MPSKNNFFSSYCFSILCFCLFIILWGAWVRISHSGDGCGQSWPSCDGQYLLEAGEESKTWIEWIHRATSGLFGIAVLLMVITAFFKFSIKHPVFKISLYVLFFTISEALIGARLVLAGLTGSNTSLARVLTMNLHLLNSLLLTSSLFICWRLSKGKNYSLSNALFYFKTKSFFFISLIVFFIIAFFGSLSSLSASLLPSPSLLEGISSDFNPESHWMIRLRLLHPLLALIFGGGFLLYYFSQGKKSDSYDKKETNKIKAFFFSNKEITPQEICIFCLILALLSGLMNLLLLSPVFLKLTHLFIVYLLSMSFLLTLEKHHSQ